MRHEEELYKIARGNAPHRVADLLGKILKEYYRRNCINLKNANDEVCKMVFVIIVLITWMIFAMVLKKRQNGQFRLSEAVLPLVLVSYLVTIDLGINYIAGAVPKLNDGIGLHSRLAFFIIGEDGWSLELFKKIYDISFTISIVLTLTFIILLLLNRRKSIQ